MQRLTSYQLTLSERASTVSSELQKEVLQSMLYNEEFDTFRPDDVEDINIGNQKKELVKAYKELSAFNKVVENKIDAHFDALDQSIQSVKSKSLSS